MKDRFKFRAYSKEDKQMYYDVQGQYDNGCTGVGTHSHADFQELLNDKDYDVMQCIGKKDDNGKFIYENDMVKFTQSRGYGNYIDWIGMVLFSEREMAFVIYLNSEDVDFRKKSRVADSICNLNNVVSIEVLGSVYDYENND